MRYVLAIDGGGTKTDSVIGDERGNIIATYRGSASNHQIVGIEETAIVIEQAISNTCNLANIHYSQLSYIFLGIAGADLDYDFNLLTTRLSPSFKGIPFSIVNDSWVALAAGSIEGWGVVSICGTGSNVAAKDKDGNTGILRALSYELGGIRGGNHIISDAMHHACRCDEKTGEYTMLVKYIPVELGCKNMKEVIYKRYTKKISNESMNKIVKLVFNLANKRDLVCQNILIKMGEELGKQISGLICKLNIQDEKVPIVLAGSIYEKGENMLLLDSLTLSLRKTVPDFELIMLDLPPVAGAYFEALRNIGINVDEEIAEHVRASIALFNGLGGEE